MIRRTMPSMQGDTDKSDSRWTGLETQKLQLNSPTMIKMNLNEGPAGTVVTLWIDDLALGQFTPKLAFNALIVDTKVVQSQGVTTLVATVPSHRETRCSTMVVPIYLCLLENDNVAATYHLTDFSYEGMAKLDTLDQMESASMVPPPLISSPPTPPHTASTTTTSTSAAQHMITSPYQDQFYHSIEMEPSMASLSSSLPGNHYSNLSVQCVLSNGNDRYQPTFRQQPTYDDDDPDMSANSTSGFTNLFTENLDPTTAPTNTLTYAPRANVIQQLQQQPACIPTNITANCTSAPPLPYHHHRHRRSSSHPRSRSFASIKASSHQPNSSVASYQPYPGLASRTSFVLVGDLNSLTENWYPEEWQCFRRLIRFHSEKSDHEIRCSFQPIAPNGMTQADRKPNHPDPTTLIDGTTAQQQYGSTTATATATSVVLSCIYWPEKNNWYITSVDCIHLLEHLMDLRFSVEEKNRVRRNLEGFRPLTVSKSKSDSADFFKLIMSFPNPKPRNIEKDLKVFPWKTLPYALKKIITKYTASAYGKNALINDHYNDNNNNTGTTKGQHRRRASYQDISPAASPTTSSTTTTLPPPPPPSHLSSSSSSSSVSSTMYQRRASAPSRDFNNSDYRPFYSMSSPTPLAYQPRPLSTRDAMAGYRFDPITSRLPPLDDPYALPDLINPSQVLRPAPPPTSPSATTSKSDMSPLFP